MKNILVPISFSEASKNALHHASLIAKPSDATISLLHCYVVEEYAREYDFGALDYEKGIKKMLINFYGDNVESENKQPLELLAYPGSVANIINEISSNFDLLVFGRRPSIESKSNNWFSNKIFYFTTRSRCPVLILPAKRDAFTFSEIKNIWHIQRKDNEVDLIKRGLFKLKIDLKLVTSKSLQQETFTSAFWRNIVNYTNNKDVSLEKISKSFADENIDLLILVNHKKDMFERFLKDDAFQIINQFDIPILVL